MLTLRQQNRLSVVLVMAILLITMSTDRATQVRASDARYFEETGFWVEPLFMDYWERNGGLMTFGYPISRVFYQDGLHKQYFERAVFEHHEQFTGSRYAVQLTRLGALNTIERRKHDPWFQPQTPGELAHPEDVYIPETAHVLDHRFGVYREANGGVQTFGYPLSEAFVELGSDGRPYLVQYFERARFELHPELAGTPYEILLGHLGREALAQRDVHPIALMRQPPTPEARDAGPIGPLPVGEPTDVACGFNYAFWLDQERVLLNDVYFDRAIAAGCTWLRIQFNWASMEPVRNADVEAILWPYDRVVQVATQRQLSLLVVVNHAPAWARPADPVLPADPEAFASFAHRLAARYAGRVDAWQVWNEPNLIGETNGLIDPAGFLPLLRAGYRAIKSADPDALVVFPGLAPCSMMFPDLAMDNTWYLETLLDINGGEAAAYFDVLAAHAYGAGNDPDSYWPGAIASNPGWTTAPEFYFRGIERTHVVLVNAGLAATPIWITELGWPAGAFCETWGYGAWINEAMQASYTVRALEIMRTEWDWVSVAFIWHLNAAEYSGANSCFAPFSVFDEAGQSRPVYDAITQLMAAPAQ